MVQIEHLTKRFELVTNQLKYGSGLEIQQINYANFSNRLYEKC